MEDIVESSSELVLPDFENGELDRNNVNENGLETINEQASRGGSSARSASGNTNGSINGDEKPELSDVFDMVCINLQIVACFTILSGNHTHRKSSCGQLETNVCGMSVHI